MYAFNRMSTMTCREKKGRPMRVMLVGFFAAGVLDRGGECQGPIDKYSARLTPTGDHDIPGPG